MKSFVSCLAALLLAAPGLAAQPDAAALEPAVDTSKPATPPVPPAPRTATPLPGTSTPRAATPPATPPAPRTAKPTAGKSAADRVDLDATQITGNRELPRVMYVVPWKKGELGDLGGKPANSLLDEVLTPVDRDVFRRQNRYYDALKPDATGAVGEGGGDSPR